MSVTGSTILLMHAVAVAAVIAAAIVSTGDAALVEHTFAVTNVKVKHLCNNTVITVVNEQFPGPAIEITEGDTVVVHVINESPHGVTIHWHGIRQKNCWVDGVGMITQCPIPPGGNYTYQFHVTSQEGTLWWHAHFSYLRATVHGAFIIRPKGGTQAYPFPKPEKEIPIIIGEWWQPGLFQVNRNILSGSFDDYPSAITINGQLGDVYNCSGVVEDGYILDVDFGKSYLLRIVNAALYYEFFYKVAGHRFTVVAVDANYVKPYNTDVIVISSGQTVDALMVANAPPSRYYMVVEADQPPLPDTQIPNFITRGVVQYSSALATSHDIPIMPQMPDVHDMIASYHFQSSFTSLGHSKQPSVPLHVDESLFISLGLGAICKKNVPNCQKVSFEDKSKKIMVASMNNVSFQFPKEMSTLEAYYNDVKGVYTEDFPSKPPRFFNFTDKRLIPFGPRERVFEITSRGTKVKRLRYNSKVEVVLQGNAILGTESHPMHLHGFDFFVLAQGFGNYDPEMDVKKYNLVDPQLRNTLVIPDNGWAVIRFVANTPGVWFFHCHFEFHIPMGMAMAFIVENGPTPDKTLPPPPINLPKCSHHDIMSPTFIGHEEE